jgi:hypothetical protein
MSVIVTGRVEVDPGIMKKLMDERPDDFRTVMKESKKRGAIHHQFVAESGAVRILDEWDTAEHFYEFFASQPIIADLMSSAGVTSPPTFNTYEVMRSPDQF